MSTQDHDFPTSALAQFAVRIDRALRRLGPLPFHGLQYRIAEVSQKRPDPRGLKRALRELSNNQRPRRGQVAPGPKEVIPGIYASSELSDDETETRSIQTLSHLRSLAGVDWQAGVTAAAEGIIDGLKWNHAEITNAHSTQRALGGDEVVLAHSVTICGSARLPAQVAVWMSYDLEWIYPDDWRLWSFLRQCQGTGGKPVVLARKISPATFSILKATGAIGLQYYSVLASDEREQHVVEHAGVVGWPRVLSSEALVEQRVMEKLRNAFATQRDRVVSESEAHVVQLGLDLGLADQSGASSEDLIKLGDALPGQFPVIWRNAVERWNRWQGYDRRSRAGIKQSTSRDVEPSSTGAPTLSTSLDAPADSSDGVPWGFGRKTKVTRIPLWLR